MIGQNENCLLAGLLRAVNGAEHTNNDPWGLLSKVRDISSINRRVWTNPGQTMLSGPGDRIPAEAGRCGQRECGSSASFRCLAPTASLPAPSCLPLPRLPPPLLKPWLFIFKLNGG